ADAQIELHDLPESALNEIPLLLEKIENLFSLYKDNSTLTLLNKEKFLSPVPCGFGQIFAEIDRIYTATNGRFDPTIQPLWRALAEKRDPKAVMASIGWHRVIHGDQSIRIGEDQELSFNGIAQGFATDLIAEHLRKQGAKRVLVDIGEISAIGGPFRIGLSDPKLGIHGWRSLKSGALATSSPSAMSLNGAEGHIIDPKARSAPLWSSVTVEAATATLADGFSTAFCHTSFEEIQNVVRTDKDIRRVTVVSNDQEISTIEA
ncbi:MAG: thiamine biosynthesis lipoprotein, partial [Halocynthiibacter sp.]